jgi:hypothetical protein
VIRRDARHDLPADVEAVLGVGVIASLSADFFKRQMTSLVFALRFID